MDRDHHHWMQQAIRAAQAALPLDVPVGALLLDESGQILASSGNRREVDQNPVGHAEMLVLQAAAKELGRWRLSETTLYVTLEPCPMCAAAIAQARVKTVVFGAYDVLAGACGSRYDLLSGTQTAILGGICEAECTELLKSFFDQKR